MTDLAPWEQRHRGLRWFNMPGGDRVIQKLNFFLFRRGKVKLKDLRADARDSQFDAENIEPKQRGEDPMKQRCDKAELAEVATALKAAIALTGRSEKATMKASKLPEDSLTPAALRKATGRRLQRLREVLEALQTNNEQEEAA